MTAREWRHPGTSHLSKTGHPPKKRPITRRFRKVVHIKGGIGRDTEAWRDLLWATPQGPTWNWEQAEGSNGGRTEVGMAEGSGMWFGDQIPAAEAGGWRVGVVSRWKMLRAGRGGV